MDRIIISDLLLRCTIGMNEEERRGKQDVVISLSLHTDLRKAGISDRLEDSVDYRALKRTIVDFVENSRYRLIESLAEAVAALCLENQDIRKAQVRVEKPGALRFARSVGVEITRTREDAAE